jgi:hypothetical protein
MGLYQEPATTYVQDSPAPLRDAQS